MSTAPRSLIRRLASLALLTGLSSAGAAATAADVQGVLTVRWGDPAATGGTIEKLQAEIIGDNGYTYAVEAKQALADGLPLFEMSGRQVVASVDARRKSDGGFRLTHLSAKNGDAAEPVADDRPWMNLLCKFADVADEPTTAARIDQAFGPNGEVTRFWQHTSGGFIDVGHSRTMGWILLPQAQAAYMDANGNPNLNKLLADCTAAAGQPLVDAVQAEEFAGINVLVNASLGCCAWGGNARATIGGTTRTWRVTWVPPSGYLNISLFAHELGHAFGMPHSNNSDGDGNTYDNPWDLLSDSTGHAVRDNAMGTMPKTPAAYHLDRAGWLASDEKRVVSPEAGTQVTLQRIDEASAGQVRMLRIESPLYANGRYYTVEARMRGGKYDGALPDDGVLLYEVDPRRAQPAWLVDASDPASNYSNTRSVVFKPGDRYVARDGSFELRVHAASANGFQVEVMLPDIRFTSGFE